MYHTNYTTRTNYVPKKEKEKGEEKNRKGWFTIEQEVLFYYVLLGEPLTGLHNDDFAGNFIIFFSLSQKEVSDERCLTFFGTCINDDVSLFHFTAILCHCD